MCASQYGKCYITNDKITRSNIDYVYKKDNIFNKDIYQNIIIVKKKIKNLLLSKGCDIMELRKKI